LGLLFAINGRFRFTMVVGVAVVVAEKNKWLRILKLSFTLNVCVRV